MDFAIFRLCIRVSLFVIALIACIIYLIKKRKLIYSIFFDKEAIKKEYTGKNDIIFLRLANTILVIVAILLILYLKDFVLEKRQKLQLAFLDFCIAACACCSVVVAVIYQKNIVLSAPLWEILAVIVFAVAVLMIILFVIYKSVKSKNV